MTTTTRRRLTALALAVSALFAGASPAREAHARLQTAPAAPPAEFKVFLVALGDNGKSGKRVGCEDSLVPVSRPLEAGAAPLATAIRALLATPPETEGTPTLENFWKGSDLALESVGIRKGTATINITGQISVAGVCDEPRIIGQIEATARQFPSVKRVRVLVNGRRLADVIR
jgi:hypothetical protein